MARALTGVDVLTLIAIGAIRDSCSHGYPSPSHSLNQPAPRPQGGPVLGLLPAVEMDPQGFWNGRVYHCYVVLTRV